VSGRPQGPPACVRAVGCLGQTSSGGRRAEAHERHGQGVAMVHQRSRSHSYDGQGSRNLCDDETLSTISHSELRQPMSGEGPPEGRVVARAVDEHGVRLLG